MGCLHLTYNLVEIFGDVLHVYKSEPSATSSPKHGEIMALTHKAERRHCANNNKTQRMFHMISLV